MRQFSLVNKSGETYRLNSLDNFMHDPSGLGFSRDTEFQKMGNAYEVISDGFSQLIVQGTIMFKRGEKNTPYRKYAKFARFLQDIPLTLHYRTMNGEEYKLDVIPSGLEKDEIKSSLGMDVNITLTSISAWYKEYKKTAEGTTIQVRSDSIMESPCDLTITGAELTDENITWTQEVNGNEIMTGSLTGITLDETDILHIKTDSNPYRIYKEDSEGAETDLYSKSDFSTKRFPLIRKGVNTITFSESGSIEVKGRVLYETV